ncbi:MAG: hypothetical protein ACXACY_19835 [Candidatus Hodarchaeales archaeon]|jgi:hypothetical protein
MAIVIGSITTVSVFSSNGSTITPASAGFQSVNWNVNRQPNRLWQLGGWNPWGTQVAKTITISLTTYAEVLGTMSLVPASSCANSTAAARVVINAQACGVPPVSLDEDFMYLTSYSYSKGDAVGFATENWSFQKWVNADGLGAGMYAIPAPSYVIQGRSEGSRFGDVGNGTTDLGVRFLDEPSHTWHSVQGQQGSVSAGFPGLGNADDVTLGLVDQAGGGKLEAGGEIGQASATIPHQPVYVG